MKYPPDVSSHGGRELQIQVGRTKTRRTPGPPTCHCIARRAGRSQLVPQRKADFKKTRGAESLSQGTLPSHVQAIVLPGQDATTAPAESMGFAGQLTCSELGDLGGPHALAGSVRSIIFPLRSSRTRRVRWPMPTRRGSSTVCLSCVVCIETALDVSRLKHFLSTRGFG